MLLLLRVFGASFRFIGRLQLSCDAIRPGVDVLPVAMVAICAAECPEEEVPKDVPMASFDGAGKVAVISRSNSPPEVSELFVSFRLRRMKLVVFEPRKLLVSPTELTLKSHTGRHASSSACAFAKAAACGSQAWLWMALPSTTAS
jgi:hypothetical protein